MADADHINSRRARDALEATGLFFEKLAGSIAAVELQKDAIKPLPKGDGTDAELIRLRQQAVKDLMKAESVFGSAAARLRDEIAEDIDATALMVGSAKPKDVAAELPDDTKQDIRTYLVIGSLHKLMKQALENKWLAVRPRCLYPEAEAFDALLVDGLKQDGAAKKRSAASMETYSLQEGFAAASMDLQEAMYNKFLDAGLSAGPTALGYVSSFLVGGSASAAAAMGMSDAGAWIMPAVAGLSGGSLATGMALLLGAHRDGAAPAGIIGHAGGASLDGVAEEGRTLMAYREGVQPEVAAKLLGEALSRAARSQGKGGAGGGTPG